MNDLKSGLKLLLNEQEPTMYICPEATLLSVSDNGALMQAMLLQSQEMQTAICIFDIIGGRNPDPVSYNNDISTFRSNTGEQGLNYGTAYYPFIGTTVMDSQEIDCTNFFGGDLKQLQALLNPPSNPDRAVTAIFNKTQDQTGTPLSVMQYNAALLATSKAYTSIIKYVLSDANILPPSGAMAGVITMTDNTGGVWQAPANTSIVSAVSLSINLSDSQLSGLNIDAVSDKQVNPFLSRPGAGILVWGARMLDGNSQDLRFIPVRRTMIMLEQSCKLAARAYVFQPNTKNTWEAVKSTIISFLTSIWKEGALQGASAADAFSVDCGLGSTMTADDILNGFMNISVKVAIVRPAEFIVLTFQQKMAVSG